VPHEAGEGVVGRPEEPRVGVGEVGGPGPQDRIREEWPWGYYPRPPPKNHLPEYKAIYLSGVHSKKNAIAPPNP